MQRVILITLVVLSVATCAPGTSLAAQSSESEPPILAALRDDDLQRAKRVIRAGADVNAPGDHGLTALSYAASSGWEEMVRLLLSHGANVNSQPATTKDTPLMVACQAGHAKIARILVEHGANVRAVNFVGETALYDFILGSKRENIGLARLLLERGADPNTRANLDMDITPLMVAARRGHGATVKLLLAHGADLHASDANGATAMWWAVAAGRLPLVQLFLTLGVDIHKRYLEDGRSALMGAAEGGYQEMVRFLLHRGADVHAKDDYGGTALTYACFSPNPSVIRLLIDHGADVNAKTQFAETPLNNAVRPPRVYRDLASKRHAPEAVQLLLDRGARIEERDGDGDTPLLMLVRGIVKRADLPAMQHFGPTPSEEQMRKATQPIVAALLKRGANTEARDAQGNTALMLTSNRGPAWLLQMLVKYRKELKDRVVTLERARQLEAWGVVEELKRAGDIR